jgi:biopolymer transport protein TolQ
MSNASEQIVNTLSSDDLALISIISDADIVVKLVVLILFLASFWSWAVVFDKFIKFRLLNHKAKKFEKRFWDGDNLENLYAEAKAQNNHPFANVFVAAMNEWHLKEINPRDEQAKERLKERIYHTMMVAKNRAAEKTEKNINFLATIAASAPFIGLFGTVWGIMDSFQSIAGAQNTSLAIVAPGIAEALLATAVGLFAAIPALIFYNIFINKLNHYNSYVEDFCVEVINLISRELD